MCYPSFYEIIEEKERYPPEIACQVEQPFVHADKIEQPSQTKLH